MDLARTQRHWLGSESMTQIPVGISDSSPSPDFSPRERARAGSRTGVCTVRTQDSPPWRNFTGNSCGRLHFQEPWFWPWLWSTLLNGRKLLPHSLRMSAHKTDGGGSNLREHSIRRRTTIIPSTQWVDLKTQQLLALYSGNEACRLAPHMHPHIT